MMFNSMKRWATAALLAGAAVAYPATAQAVIVVPGTSVAVVSDNGNATGTLLDSTSGCDNAGLLDACVLARVYENPITGFADFYYQITNNSAAAIMNRATHYSFQDASVITDVYYRTDGVGGDFTVGGVIPSGTLPALDVDRSLDGSTVGFEFKIPLTTQGNVPPGSFTAVMIIKTNRPYAIGGTSAINGGTVDFVTFAVPEPASLALLGLAFLGAGLRARRRQ